MDVNLERCHCGRPLHYSNPSLQAMVERLIALAGSDYVTVTVAGRTWLVQRHYIALHGLRAGDLSSLGFEEITDGGARSAGGG